MPVPAYHRRLAAVRSAFNPGLLMIGFILLATVVAVAAVTTQTPRRRHTLTVFTAGTKPHSPGYVSGVAGAKLHPSPAQPPPSPSGSPAISSAPAPPPVPPVAFIPNEAPAVPAPDPAPAPVETPDPPSGRETAVAYALRQLGKPYRFGAAGDSSFDCSGLVMRAWQAAGVFLPRTTYEMARVGTRITRNQLQRGDLVFLYGYGHVVLYIGDGDMVEAPRPGAVVRIRPLPSRVDAYVRVSGASL